MSTLDVISDRAKENLPYIPEDTLQQTNLKMIFFEGNKITELPLDFFVCFPRLLWLDLRNNLLESIPKSIAHHQTLESMLLSNNKLVMLPNELGTVTTIRTLQVSENPLEYPEQDIIKRGTKCILTFLKDRYDKDMPVELPNEQVVSVYDNESSNVRVNKQSSPFVKSGIIRELLNAVDSRELKPTLSVKKLVNPKIKPIIIKRKEPIKIIHQIKRNPSKMSLKSFYNDEAVEQIRVNERALKDAWLEKIKVLLADQEKILQQEKNLRALTSWRSLKKQETITTLPFNDVAPPPFATYEEHKKMMTREDLSKELSTFFKEQSISPNRPGTSYQEKLENMVDELIIHLKDLESRSVENQTPRREMEDAGEQIKMIMEIHKRILQIQGYNKF